MALAAAVCAPALLRPGAPPPAPAAAEAEHLAAVVRPGDVICRLGAGLWSELFRERSRRERRFSHVGIVAETGGRWCVLHADADDVSGRGAVRAQALADFLADSVEWAVYRYSGTGASVVAERAGAYLGRPFDTGFDLADATRIYCSELVFRAFADAQIEGVVGVTSVDGRTFVGIDDCYLSPAMALVLEGRAAPESDCGGRPGGG